MARRAVRPFGELQTGDSDSAGRKTPSPFESHAWAMQMAHSSRPGAKKSHLAVAFSLLLAERVSAAAQSKMIHSSPVSH